MSALTLRTAARRAAPALTVPAGAMSLRAASTAASSSPDASTEPSSLPGQLPMSWTTYLKMRKRRKNWSTITTVPSTLGGLVGGAGYFASQGIDPSGTILGLDATIAIGGGVLGCAILGYLVGPSIGNGLFAVTHPKLARGNPPPLEVMDREFYERIKRKRADPSRASVNNPPPDFYGEKIVSLASYRRWLKDQQAYRRKASHGVPGEVQ